MSITVAILLAIPFFAVVAFISLYLERDRGRAVAEYRTAASRRGSYSELDVLRLKQDGLPNRVRVSQELAALRAKQDGRKSRDFVVPPPSDYELELERQLIELREEKHEEEKERARVNFLQEQQNQNFYYSQIEK
jgi:hypothetical protein